MGNNLSLLMLWVAFWLNKWIILAILRCQSIRLKGHWSRGMWQRGATLASFHSNSLDLNDAWAVDTDYAAYCLKAYREVLKGVMPNSVHVTCLCHIINLVGETWQHYKYFSDATLLVTWMRSVFFKKPARKRRWVAFLINKECVQAKVPHEAVCTR